MRRLTLAVTVILAVGAASAGYWMWSQDQGDGGEPDRPRSRAAVVTVAPARLAPVEDLVDAVGTVEPLEAVAVTAETVGVVRQLRFDDGDRVREGDILVNLDAEIQAAELTAARATLEQTQAAYGRAKALQGRGTVSEAALDEALAALRTAQADVTLAETRLAKRTIKAPFGGILSFRRVSPGAYVEPGDAIATLYEIDPVEVEFRLPEQYLGRLETGQPVAARTRAYQGQSFQGQLAEVDTAIDPATRQLVARATFANPDGRLRPGMLVTVSIRLEVRDGVTVPATAVVSVGPSSFVFVPQGDGTVLRRPVQLGRRMPGMVEVTQGLAADEPVVVDGATKLSDGDRIDPKPPEQSPVREIVDPQVAQRPPPAPAGSPPATGAE